MEECMYVLMCVMNEYVCVYMHVCAHAHTHTRLHVADFNFLQCYMLSVAGSLLKFTKEAKLSVI
jgi:hypothetical protein